jgi:hypothetical protein
VTGRKLPKPEVARHLAHFDLGAESATPPTRASTGSRRRPSGPLGQTGSLREAYADPREKVIRNPAKLRLA